MKKKYMKTTDYLEARARQPSHAEKLFVLGGKFLSEPCIFSPFHLTGEIVCTHVTRQNRRLQPVENIHNSHSTSG